MWAWTFDNPAHAHDACVVHRVTKAEPTLDDLKAIKLAEQADVRQRFERGELVEIESAGIFAGLPQPKLVSEPSW